MEYRRILLILSLALTACGADMQHSDQKDIFLEDANNTARRREAEPELRGWAINMGGCTGHLIAPEYMMTASHCSPRAGATYTSGAAMNQGNRGDIQVVRVMENDRSLDYTILQIRWRNSLPQGQKYPALIATSQSSVSWSSASNQGDVVFTVGFPGDKSSTWGATYSEGQLKALSGSDLLYNMGIINGNSGGGVWRKSDGMLVSLTNGGPRALGQSGWNQGRLDNPGSWNHGAAMWKIYAVSSVLRDIFPNGRNRFVTASPIQTEQPLWVMLHPSTNTGTFVDVSVPSHVASVLVCFGQKTCEASTPGAMELVFNGDGSGRRIFRSQAALNFVSGQDVAFATLDSAGAAVGVRHLKFVSR